MSVVFKCQCMLNRTYNTGSTTHGHNLCFCNNKGSNDEEEVLLDEPQEDNHLNLLSSALLHVSAHR